MWKEKIPSEYLETFDKLISYSDSITRLYMNLCDVEYKYGRDSEEYKKYVSYIEMAVDYENRKIDASFNDTSVLSLFKEYMSMQGAKRLLERFNNDFSLSQKLFYASENDKYDELIERRLTMVPREEFLQNDFDNFGKSILRTNTFYLAFLKTYLTIMDDYINSTNDEKMKKFLIYEKNMLIANNRSLESWYFGFDNSDLEGMLVDSDYISAYKIGIPIDTYRDLKSFYFFGLCTDFLCLAIMNCDDIEEVRLIYELNILASMLNMDVKSLNFSYSVVIDELKNNKDKYNDEIIDYVEGIYSKSLKMSKKMKREIPKEEDV